MNPVAKYLESKEVFLDEHELEDLTEVVLMHEAYRSNIGIRSERTKDNEREKAFQLEWLKENEPKSYINFGHGCLQDLFIESSGSPFNTMSGRTVVEEITPRDRKIVATVIQWLGSNCGMSFLSEALARFGARIVFKNDK